MKKKRWNINKKLKPKKGGEYQVVWNLDDNQYPVTTCMDWNSIKKVWTDPKCDNMVRTDDEILYWKELDKPPRGIKKSVYMTQEGKDEDYVAIGGDFMKLENQTFGKCIHGKNLASCEKCNQQPSKLNNKTKR
jgi:uncharacterized protein YeeX (DUF496 family)